MKLADISYSPLLSVAFVTACALYHLVHSLQGTCTQALSDSRTLALYLTNWGAPEGNQVTGMTTLDTEVSKFCQARNAVLLLRGFSYIKKYV